MKNSDLISIIVPVYNCERYLEKCLNSILAQTYPNYEVIVVDDCSTDHSYELLQTYRTNPKISIYQNERNLGAAATRNLALSYAKGSYIGFVDGDDFIEERYYELLYHTCMVSSSPLAVASIMCIYEQASYKNTLSASWKDKMDLVASGYVASPCNKLIKRELLELYPFPEGMINEDITVMIPLVILADSLANCEEAIYYYVQHQDSVQNACVDERKLQVFDAVNMVWERIGDQRELYEEAIVYSQLITFLRYRILENPDQIHRKKMFKQYRDRFNQYDWWRNSFLKTDLKQLSRKNRIYQKLLLFLFRFHCDQLLSWIIGCKLSYQEKRQKSVIPTCSLDQLVASAKRLSQLPKKPISVSVVIPNYNYESFLVQRVFSILNQTYPIKELILLDDHSTDHSWHKIEQLKEVLTPYIPVLTVQNEENQGVFSQWEKGFSLATGDYVWIAEADDYCDLHFLESVTKPCISDSQVVLSYSNTSFVDQNGVIVYRNILPEIDLTKSGHWNQDYVIDGKQELQQYLYLNCTISNVSSVLIRRNIPLSTFQEAKKYKQIGDWMFYVAIAKLGKIAYCSKRLNYYRIHGLNVTSMTKKQLHYDEIKSWYHHIEEQGILTEQQRQEIKKRQQFLEMTWKVK